MKKLAASLLTLSLLSPTLAMAHGGHGGPGFNILPDAAVAVVIGGLTYWALNGNYYQKQGDDYVEVDAPPQDDAPPPPPESEEDYESAPPDLAPLDFHGERFYVSNGHYYKRDPSGQYYEIPRPDGL
ncbi:hypothetical protein BS639_02820 [Rouxiella silvae]|uniref:Uncharacterized protein n=1 Tax=Rouxiella silvae TaxID=1646373 RepID=A0AA40X6X7_9GAMM|nr:MULTISPECIES: DUF6515 family protein [Rouxiella]KAB7894626.1 hypothetical protein GA565_00790 [Rouxiella sp. S1S-2]KQN50558.1 hypothetical protein ASE93_22525 [Serratia sp. Leaf50]MBF6639579.1 hypothetical protein [Rouxiella silvae]ORJ22773.1 hypothetical protein BS639_02820 [Rouxiella silvae]